ncbi:MAG: hypothetical protein IJX65_02310 [Alistipes sp.]|nr:hypothetical protein [Alistipes sp.]
MYAVETTICSALFYALYRLFIEGRVAHRVARAYITGSMLLAVVIPLLELPILPAERSVELSITQFSVITPAESTAQGDIQTAQSVDWIAILVWVYSAITLLFMVRLAVGIVRIVSLRRHSHLIPHKGYTMAVNSSIPTVFSFGRTIFTPQGELCEQIVMHEKSHIAHHHTTERILFESLRTLMWFNPFVHFAFRSIQQVQEWEADGDVISSGYDIYEYRQIIFHQLFEYTPDITCGLNSNLTKKRFIMMTKLKMGRYHYLRILAVIPIAVAMIFAFGSVKAQPEQQDVEPTIVKSFDIKSTIKISKGGKEILLNNQPATIEQLVEIVKQGIDSIATITADNDVPMGAVADVKAALREGGVTKVNYSTSEPTTPTATETTTKSIKERNILIVNIDAEGNVTVRGKECNPQQLKRTVKDFIRNYHIYALNTRKIHIVPKRDDYSEYGTVGLNMPDGKRMCCTVSKGIVSICSELPKESAAVESTSAAIYEAFMELRNYFSRRIYNSEYADLDEVYKAEINKAVPLNISLAERQ